MFVVSFFIFFGNTLSPNDNQYGVMSGSYFQLTNQQWAY